MLTAGARREASLKASCQLGGNMVPMSVQALISKIAPYFAEGSALSVSLAEAQGAV